MHIPDRVIVRKLKEYDPYLFIEWNSQEQYFELWREMPHGRRLITPITQSIYDTKKPILFCQLDERLLWWVAEADSWKTGGSRSHAKLFDKRYIEFIKNSRIKRKEIFYDASKDAYRAVNNFYVTRATKKFSDDVKVKSWVKPDSPALTSNHVFARTKTNAVKYNFRKG